MSLSPTDLTFLAKAPLMERFSPEEIKRFSAYLQPQEYSEGQVIIWEDSPQRSLCLLVRGVAVVTKVIRGEVESVLARLSPGAHFGELSLLGQGTASCNVTAEEPCRVLLIDHATLERMFEEQSDLFAKLAWAMLRDLAGKLRATNQKVQEAVEWGLDAASLDPW
jgi:CRP/FNR family cyclic AMP-dependent transcriptional regulator